MSTKVFVGNLSFKIAPEKLREEFSAAGNVLTANIITRGPRSLGYGFVEFGSREEAEKSVTLLNHKDIDGRQINVEVAKPRVDLPEREKRQDDQEGGQRPPRRTRRPRDRDGDRDAPRNNNNNSNVQGGGPAPRGRGPQHQQSDAPPRRMYKPRYQNQDNAGGNLANEGQSNNAGRNFNNNNYNASNHNFTNDVDNDDTNRGFRRRRRNNNPNRGPRQDQQVPQQPQQSQQPQFRRKRLPAQPRKQQERVSSPTTLFVANLPFSVDDKELAEIFSTKWKVVSAHVVKKRNTRSKGFGFVEFENEPDQQAALKDFDGFTLHERVLNVKVALTALPGAEGEEDAAGAEKPVAAEGGEKEPHAEEKGGAAEPKVEVKEVKAEAPAATEGADEKKGGQ